MVIAGSTGLGLFLVNSFTTLSDSFPSILSSIFPAPQVSGTDPKYVTHIFTKREEELSETKKIIFGCLIPILVILSGVFAGLTLGYMSLDETQLNVLSISGTALVCVARPPLSPFPHPNSSEQKRYAEKIKPIRKNGHLLLVTLLLSNMIVNETLPVIADPVLGGGFQGVVVSTVLIVL
jgi:metal transporter CNNM